MFFQKIRSYEEGKGKGRELRLDNIPKIRENRDRMYEWIIILMGYIEEMFCWDKRIMRTKIVTIIIQEAAELGELVKPGNLDIPNQESHEDYAKRIIDFFEETRVGEEVTILEDGDEVTEFMIENYQRSAIPNQCNLRLVEFYGGEEWRKNKGAELKICIQRIVEAELEEEYQKNLEPSEERKESETIELFPKGWFTKLVMQSDK